MWGSTNYGEALRFLEDQVRDEEAFVEEVRNVTQHLRNGDPYFRVNHATDRRLLQGDEDVAAVGIVANGNGYVFARRETAPYAGTTEQFCFMGFERVTNRRKPYLHTTAYAESLKFAEDELPDSHYTRTRNDLYYRLLKEVSPQPDEDIRVIRPDYTPPGPRTAVHEC